MATGETTSCVTDEDIAEIVALHEAGLNDLLEAYAPIEQHYMVAAGVQSQVIVASTNTITG